MIDNTPAPEGGFTLKGVPISYKLIEAQVTPTHLPRLEPGQTYTVKLRLVSPALLTNPFTANQHIRRYFPTP